MSSYTKSLGAVLGNQAIARPEAAAVVSSRFEPFSYRQLADQIDNVRSALRRAGLGAESRIAIALKDAPRAALAIVSVSCSAIAVPVDPNLTFVEVETRLRLVEADAALVLSGDDSPLRRSAEALGIIILEAIPAAEERLSFSLSAPKKPLLGPNGNTDACAPAFILQSSGTTAEPKLVCFKHGNMLAAAARVQRWFNLRESDRCLSVSPAYYSHGLKLTVFTSLLSGGSVAVPENQSRINLSEWFDYLEPTWFSASPSMHRAILEKIQQQKSEKLRHRLRFALSGGAPLQSEIQLALQSHLGVPVLEHYGSTEAAQVSTNFPPPGPAKLGTCGMPEPDTVMIIGPGGVKLGAREQGEIVVGGPTLVEGYLNAPELTKAVFVDGWFHTGDLGSIDEEGFLSLRGRLSEIINRGGEKISPAEIEAAILRHPDVAEAAVFSVPHPRLGEDVGAAVVLRANARAVPNEIRRFLSTQLAWFKVPRRIMIVQSLPKSGTGKVQRRKLSEIYGAR
jgi:acyl-CoA synthetase (AMP-forming)/AMP-acid ligase II